MRHTWPFVGAGILAVVALGLLVSAHFNAAVLLLCVAFVIAGAAWLRLRTENRLAALTETAARYSRGDWDARVPIDPYRRSDKLSDLAHDFNQMADEVQRRFLESRRERDQLQAVLANMSDGVLAIDSGGIVRLVNEAFLRFYRSILPDPINHHHAEVFRDRELNELVEKLLAGEVKESEELETTVPRRRLLVARPALIEAARGNEARGVLVVRDVTARRQIEQMRRDFVANVSHELRTPLTAVIGYISALRDLGVHTSGAETFLDTIERNAARMDRIVGDLLELAQIEAPGYQPARAEFALTKLFEDVRVGTRHAVEGKRQTLAIDIAPDAERINADRDALERMMMNLIDNACKYTPEGGRIDVSAGAAEGDLMIVVADNGIGVPEADQPRLFERFFRVDRGRSRDLGGTGLGLSIVKHLAEAHGGAVFYEPNLPAGSRFIVRLPQFPPAAAAACDTTV
jgi:two-component system phosphate regulon sensor histidine kinase PhoR